MCQKCGSKALGDHQLLQKLPRPLFFPAVSRVLLQLHGHIPWERPAELSLLRALRDGACPAFPLERKAPILWDWGREHMESSQASQAECGPCMWGFQGWSRFWVASV